MDVMKDVFKKMENALIIYVKIIIIILINVTKIVLRIVLIKDVIYIVENVLFVRKGNVVKNVMNPVMMNVMIMMIVVLLEVRKKKKVLS
jgi:hypothetical protein